MTNVLEAKFVGSPANSPALVTVAICAVSADANTSAFAPCVNCVASSEDPPKSKSTPLPGLSVLNCWLIWVNAGLSEAAANTTIDPEACDGWDGDDEGDFELQKMRPASSAVHNKPGTPIRRMGEH